MVHYPFAAVVGQEKLKIAYLANIVNPYIGGLLVSGPKGTGKSTIVHSVGSILPEYRYHEDCLFRCNPAQPQRWCPFCREKSSFQVGSRQMRVINLPLSCTEDRLIGSIDVEKLLDRGGGRGCPHRG